MGTIKNIAFITGARSEYGLARKLLFAIDKEPKIDLQIVVHGMHLIEDFGFSVNEIYSDGFYISAELSTINSESIEKSDEFIITVKFIYNFLCNSGVDAVLLIGDRLETFGAALSAHFCSIPIIHSGGGHFTAGALDNIYRFAISQFANVHLTTSKIAFERVRSLPLVDKNCVHFIGSVAVDSIKDFLNKPHSIVERLPELVPGRFSIMTFHPATTRNENLDNILIKCVETIIKYNYQVLITYPNNDTGSDKIIGAIDSVRDCENVFVVPHLGVADYYAALRECAFVVGNSSSAISEAPYFHTPVINVGDRQTGREKDVGITDVPADIDAVKNALDEGFNKGWPRTECSDLYGSGDSVRKAVNAIKSYLYT